METVNCQISGLVSQFFTVFCDPPSSSLLTPNVAAIYGPEGGGKSHFTMSVLQRNWLRRRENTWTATANFLVIETNGHIQFRGARACHAAATRQRHQILLGSSASPSVLVSMGHLRAYDAKFGHLDKRLQTFVRKVRRGHMGLMAAAGRRFHAARQCQVHCFGPYHAVRIRQTSRVTYCGCGNEHFDSVAQIVDMFSRLP